MKIISTLSILIIIFILCLQSAESQQKGSFNVNVNISTGSRQLAYYVPANYDSTKKYSLMICLHGSGQPAYSYRDNLCPAWATFILNTIFVCPEGGGSAGDFYNSKGDETIIDSAISYTLRNYSIDTSQIILEGFSLGGRSALKYGLEHPEKFKGLLLNTPAVQSQLDVKNDATYSLHYEYQNAPKIAIAITHGANDGGYYFLDDTLYKILTDYDGKVLFTRITGMGHAIPPTAVTQACLSFINNPLPNNVDADITKILKQDRIYESNMKPFFRLRNRGTSLLTTAKVTYSINDVPAEFTWNGSLASFEHADVELPEISCIENINKIIVRIDSINGVVADPNLSGKQYTSQFQSLTKSLPLPIVFGFELNEPSLDYWSLENSGGMWSWGVYTDAHTEGNNALLMYNIPGINVNQGLSENNLSPLMDLTTVKNPCLVFDVAFNYIKFTSSAYLFTDTLKVLMTTDSGKSYINLYNKAGAELASVPSPITNPSYNNLNNFIFVPTAINQWRTEIIKLDSYMDKTKAAFIFKDVSGMGGSLWIDNIRFMSYDDISDVGDENGNSLISIYPNPAKDYVYVQFPENTKSISIYNLKGTEIYRRNIQAGDAVLQINSESFESGIYILKVTTLSETFNKKLIIVK